MSNLESDFETEVRKTIKEATAKIDACLNRAYEALEEAEAISEEFGVPFYSSISPLGQDYRPASFLEKWKVDEDDCYHYSNGFYAKNKKKNDSEKNIWDILNEEKIDFPEYEGWQHSAVC